MTSTARILAMAKMVWVEIFRKKDFYVAFILVGVVLVYAANLRFYNIQGISRYLMDLGLALIFFSASLLTILLAARQYPNELRDRTLQVLLSKPVSRFEFVIAKFLGSLAAGLTCFILFILVFLFIVLSRAGSISWVTAFQTVYLFALNLAVLAAMTSAFSYFFTLGANVTTTFILYLTINLYGGSLGTAAAGLKGPAFIAAHVAYWVIPHFEFFDARQRFVHQWPALSAPLVFEVTLYAFLYTAFFILLGWSLLRRRKV